MLVNYVDKILSFSQNRTYSKDEAEELTQEILLRAVKNLSAIKDIDKFEAWLWGLANNTLKSFRRNKGKEREMYSSEDIGAQIYNDEYKFEQDEVYNTLRKNVAYLSASYRDIIIMHYYDGFTCKEIAEKLNIPEGTVTYRLTVGRNKLKKEYSAMQETALKPVKLKLYTNGSYNGTPWMYLNDALSKNILWQAYREPKSVEDLSKLLGIPAFYIEDRIEMLDKCGTITKPTQNTILTDILIYDESINKYDDIQTKECFNAISEELWDKMNRLTAKILELDIHTANKTHDELACLFCIMAFDHFIEYAEYNSNLSTWVEPPERFDGWKWEYSACTEGYKHISPYNNRNWIDTEKHTIGHIVYAHDPFARPNAMRPQELKVCEKIMNGESITESDKEAAALAIKNGFLKKSGEKIEINVPYFSFSQYQKFRELLPEMENMMPSIQKQVKKYRDGYKKLFPSHLKNKVDSSGITCLCLVKKGINEWAKSGKINIPADSVCDVLVEHDGGMFFKID